LARQSPSSARSRGATPRLRFGTVRYMVTVRDVEYPCDGKVSIGRLAIPEGDGPFPGILVAHEANGLDEFQRGRPERLAALGYAAFAMDYHGAGHVFGADDRDAMMARLNEIGEDPDRLRLIARAALDALLAEPGVDPSRIAATGYCFGAAVVMELARSGADLKAVVGFHPGMASSRPEDSRSIVAKVLMCVGADDPIIPREARAAFEDEMRAAGVDWRLNLYGGAQHSFTHPGSESIGMPGLKYDRTADERSWRAMLDLFDEVF
jgi:dienelactone hydrolase